MRIGRPLLRALVISLAAHSLLFLPRPSPPPIAAGAPLRARLQYPAAHVDLPTEEYRQALTMPGRADPRQPEVRSEPPASVSTPAAASPTPAGDAAADSLQPGVDLVGLREYNISLARSAARFRSYPRQAWEAGKEGRVVLRLRVSDAGVPIDLALLRGSGHDELDRAALDMMRLAASHTAVPERLYGREFSIDLAVDYDLRSAPTGP